MVLYKVVIGLAFNHRSFKVAGVAGSLADELIEMSRQSSVKGGFPDYDQYASNNDYANFASTLLSSRTGNTLEIQNAQVMFSHNSPDLNKSLNLDTSLDEFMRFYKVIAKALKSPAVRRIGIVGEFYCPLPDVEASPFLASHLLKMNGPRNQSKRFHLTFDDQESLDADRIIDINSSSFWNTIYNVYPSALDSSRASDGGFRVTLDVQRYFNPAPSDVNREIRPVIERFRRKKDAFKADLKALGLLDV